MRVSRRYKQCFASQRGKSTTRIFAATWAPLSYGTRVGAPFRLLLVRAYSTLKGVWQHIRRTIAGAISQPGSWIREPYASIPIQFVIIQSRPIDKASPASRFLRLCQRRLVRQRVADDAFRGLHRPRNEGARPLPSCHRVPSTCSFPHRIRANQGKFARVGHQTKPKRCR